MGNPNNVSQTRALMQPLRRVAISELLLSRACRVDDVCGVLMATVLTVPLSPCGQQSSRSANLLEETTIRVKAKFTKSLNAILLKALEREDTVVAMLYALPPTGPDIAPGCAAVSQHHLCMEDVQKSCIVAAREVVSA
eukprot:554310-Amphidinium_carterae.1